MSINASVVGAIRLACEGTPDESRALELIEWLLEQAPDTEAGDTASVTLLLDGIRALGFVFSVPS